MLIYKSCFNNSLLQLIIVQESNKLISLPKFNSQHDSYLCNVNNVNKNHDNDTKGTKGYINPIYFNHKDNIEILKVSKDYENQNYFAETNFTHLIKNCKISLNKNLKFANDYKIQIFLKKRILLSKLQTKTISF